VLATRDEPGPHGHEPLIVPVMRGGRPHRPAADAGRRTVQPRLRPRGPAPRRPRPPRAGRPGGPHLALPARPHSAGLTQPHHGPRPRRLTPGLTRCEEDGPVWE
jgi:hypothetical protein